MVAALMDAIVGDPADVPPAPGLELGDLDLQWAAREGGAGFSSA